MPLSDAFNPISLAGSVFANIATDILKHHAQALEGTLVGKILKQAGLIKPNFNERLQATLINALDLYFKTYPNYALTGIEAVFRDPVVAQQIGNNILDRRSIDLDQIQHSIDQHFGKDAVTKILLEQRGLEPNSIVNDFLKCYRRVLGEQLDVPQMAIMLAMTEQIDTVIEEIRASENRQQAFVQEQIIKHINAQTGLLERLVADQQAIKQSLGLDRPQAAIVEEIEATLNAAPRAGMFEPGGVCGGYPLRPMPDRYFVAQEFSPDRGDLRDALAKALEASNVHPVVADDFLWSGAILCKISSLIQSTPFGVYELTAGQNRNVYLELGIAIGLGRAFVLIKEVEAEASSLVEGMEYYNLRSYASLRRELGSSLQQYFLDIARYQAPNLSAAGSEATYIIAHGDHNMPPDFCLALAEALAERGLTPILIGGDNSEAAQALETADIPFKVFDKAGKTHLDAATQAIQASHFGIYRVDEDCSPDTFLALGIAMGLNRPWGLVSRKGVQLPVDVRGLSRLEFRSFHELGEQFLKQYRDFLERYS